MAKDSWSSVVHVNKQEVSVSLLSGKETKCPFWPQTTVGALKVEASKLLHVRIKCLVKDSPLSDEKLLAEYVSGGDNLMGLTEDSEDNNEDLKLIEASLNTILKDWEEAIEQQERLTPTRAEVWAKADLEMLKILCPEDPGKFKEYAEKVQCLQQKGRKQRQDTSGLENGAKLKSPDFLESTDKRFRLVLNETGILTLLRTPSDVLWSSCQDPVFVSHQRSGSFERGERGRGTAKPPTFTLAIEEAKSSVALVIRDSTNQEIWSTKHRDKKNRAVPGGRLELQNNGLAILFDGNNAPVWSTGTEEGRMALPHIWGIGDHHDSGVYRNTMMHLNDQDRAKMERFLYDWAYTDNLVRKAGYVMADHLKDQTDHKLIWEIRSKLGRMTVGYNPRQDQGQANLLDECVVSFPGKFGELWKKLLKNPRLALACVYLPKPEAFMRFFKANHARDPDAALSKRCFCYCHRFHEMQKEQGCIWFELWKCNVLLANDYEQDLVVVYNDYDAQEQELFARIDGGNYKMTSLDEDPDLPHWADIRGPCRMQNYLGQSQKAEVAWLLKKKDEFERKGRPFKLRFVGLRMMEQKHKLGLFQEVNEDPLASQKALISKLETPDTVFGGRLAERRNLMPEDATTLVVIGETGVGKSSFCGLGDGTLEWTEEGWTSRFKVGHSSGNSTTREVQLEAGEWLNEKDSHVIFMDTPGLGDSQGEERDQKTLQEVGCAIRELGCIHAVVLVLDSSPTFSGNLRKELLAYQRLLGEEMWQHCVVVVNRWQYDAYSQKKREQRKSLSVEGFSQFFRKMLTEEKLLSLDEDTAERIQFFFIDTTYERDAEDDQQIMEQESMKEELSKLWTHLSNRTELPDWRVAPVYKSDTLIGLIEAAQSGDPEALLKAFTRAEDEHPRPPDVTEEKLCAIEMEAKKRSQDIKIYEAQEALLDFEYSGSVKDAELFQEMVRCAKEVCGPEKLKELPALSEYLQAMLDGSPCRPQCPPGYWKLESHATKLWVRKRTRRVVTNFWVEHDFSQNVDPVLTWAHRKEPHTEEALLQSLPELLEDLKDVLNANTEQMLRAIITEQEKKDQKQAEVEAVKSPTGSVKLEWKPEALEDPSAISNQQDCNKDVFEERKKKQQIHFEAEESPRGLKSQAEPDEDPSATSNNQECALM